jgi:hypothetical protein
VDTVDAGTLIILHLAGRPWHCALAVNKEWMLHTLEGVNACLERMDSMVWNGRIEGFTNMASELMIPVTARPHPMSMETVHAEFPAGLTIAEILGPEAKACRVEMGGMTIPEESWSLIRPKPGHAIIIMRFSQGGSDKSIFRIIAFAVLAIGVVAISGGALLGASLFSCDSQLSQV